MLPSSITIVGGGTAGWMTAALLAKQWAQHKVSISLIESKKIGTLGVGEGSTPFLRDLFKRLGVSEQEWMPSCDATYKFGIAFPHWCEQREGVEASYFHPFYAEIDAPMAPHFFSACQHRQQGFDTPCHPDDYFLTSYLAKQNQLPTSAGKAIPGLDYGYHFDASKLGQFLMQYACKLGVNHIIDEVTSVEQNESGITAIHTAQSGALQSQFYVDCSGLKGLLIQQTLGESLLDYSQYLPNNRAVAIQCQHKQGLPVGGYTLSKAVKQGWIWSIPLQSRNGNGLVYSADYVSAQEAEAALREQINEHSAPAMHLRWNVGRIEQHWKRNCVAVGMSQGFLEPLEAPMLNTVQQTIESFIDYMEQSTVNNIKRSSFNQTVNRLIDGTCDYLQAHYKLNTRTDSQYWLENRERPTRNTLLNEVMAAWKGEHAFEPVLAKYEDQLAYGKTSWYCILAGMQHFQPLSKGSVTRVNQQHQKILSYCQSLAKRFDSAESQLLSARESIVC